MKHQTPLQKELESMARALKLALEEMNNNFAILNALLSKVDQKSEELNRNMKSATKIINKLK